MTEEHQISNEAQRRVRDLERDTSKMRADVSEIKTQVALMEQRQGHMQESIEDGQAELKAMRDDIKTAFRKIFYPVAAMILTMVIQYMINGGFMGELLR